MVCSSACLELEGCGSPNHLLKVSLTRTLKQTWIAGPSASSGFTYKCFPDKEGYAGWQGAEKAWPGHSRDWILVSQEHVQAGQAQCCLCSRFTSCPDLTVSHLTPCDRCPPNIMRPWVSGTSPLGPCPFVAWMETFSGGVSSLGMG